MPFSFISITKLPTLGFIFNVLFFSLLITTTSYGAHAANEEKVTKVGAILDVSSRIGKERKAAMEVAARNFNNSSKSHKLSLRFQDSTREEPLTAASSAENMIEAKNVEVIIGMETWQEAALVAEVGNQTQVPVISLVAPSITPISLQFQWPFLISMANDASAEINCIADLVSAYYWRKVVVIYEDDEYGGDSGDLALLNEALQKVGSEIEYRLALPPYSSLPDPKGVVLDELLKLLSVQSRTFIVLRASSPMLNHLFREAKKIGLLERESAWILTESVTSLLDSVDNSVISIMKGTLGIKTYYSTKSSSYQVFRTQFQRTFQQENPDESDLNPGIYALQAYDSIRAVTQALERIASNTSVKMLMENILSANFDGLSGKVSFKDGKLLPNQILRIVNVVDVEDKELSQEKGIYNELDCWMPQYGFSECLVAEKVKVTNRRADVGKNSDRLNGSVVWPGNLVDGTPKGWAMPTILKPLRIGVPGDTQFKKFVTVDESRKYSNEGYDGFCIQIFRSVLQHLNYSLPYQFVAYNGSYDELVDAVYNKTYDAAVGDVTILSERSNKVEFTQPYAESGLSMIIPIKSRESTWMFIKPFTWEVWLVTVALLAYTMFIVWFLEHGTNTEFGDTEKDQIGTAFSFTFSSLFFAQREAVQSDNTRVAVTIWLSVVFILTASYTANLSSMLTVKQLEQDIDIEWIRRTNQKVGCDGDSFVKEYLASVLDFNPDNIYSVPEEYDYLEWFEEKKIAAAFLELPYEKVFMNKYCKRYTTASGTYRFGGLGFVFQKGSPIARDVSEAILKLSENGNITRLERQCLTPLDECSSTTIETERLSLKSFKAIYILSGATSTICFLISLVRLLRNYPCHQQANGGNQTIKAKVLGLARYINNGEFKYSPGRVSITTTSVSSPDTSSPGEGSFSSWECVSTSDAAEHHDTSPRVEIEMPTV
ncbi:Ionotropic glutamate receptor [Parasponia andersonii]|uniref:Glutamate receptor n=1 Tax=Parasponia andersonii TaxID=3476 RepID=A0A2P5DX96_PARAD|nr:Ionotropic glutamate receptor [Parasponia andersonii]